jgi:hypothetical protein
MSQDTLSSTTANASSQGSPEPRGDSEVTAKRPGSSTAPIYRSVADGELATPWTLSEYFASLNTVLRLPAKVRRKAEAVAKRTPGGETALAFFDRIKLPGWVIPATVTVAIAFLVIRPLMAAASGSSADLSQASGLWEAGKGKYQGRMFEIRDGNIAFRTSSKSPDFSWHQIQKVAGKTSGDSTLFTVTYKEEGKTSDFSFFYFARSPSFVRFLHQPDVIWTKSASQPMEPPKN